MAIEKTTNNPPPGSGGGGDRGKSPLESNSLPRFEMKKMSQSELYSLSCSSSSDFPEKLVIPNIHSEHQSTSSITTTTTSPSRIFAFSHRRGPHRHVSDEDHQHVTENRMILNSLQKLVAEGEMNESRKHKRKSKGEASGSNMEFVVVDNKRKRKSKAIDDIEGFGTVTVDGEEIDLKYLATVADKAFENELNKRTVGMVSEVDFLGFVNRLEGRWASSRMRRKFVDAAIFMKALPVNWKILLSLRPRVRPPSLYCRRFVSPSDIHFESCKEVAFYLKSQVMTNEANPPEEGAMIQIESDCQVDLKSDIAMSRNEPRIYDVQPLKSIPMNGEGSSNEQNTNYGPPHPISASLNENIDPQLMENRFILNSLDKEGDVQMRKRKRQSKAVKEIEDLGVVDVYGEEIDLKYLATVADKAFKDKLNKMTVGMVSEEEYLGFVNGLEGQWGSRRKRRKYVDAAVFIKTLPIDWKILVSLHPRLSQPSLYFRRFVSPSNYHFKSCKDVAFYLKSQFVTNDANPPEEGAIIQIESGHQVDLESDIAMSNEPRLYDVQPLKSIPMNGEGSSNEPKNNSEAKKNLKKTRCMWCLIEFFRDPFDAETLATSSGFKCPKCKEEISQRIKSYLSKIR